MPDQTPELPQPPRWAAHSVAEDGGFTHEVISEVYPLGLGALPEAPSQPHATEISLSVVDRPGPDGWVRAEPTVQVEGGMFTIPEAHRLRQALDDVLSKVEAA